MPTQLEEILFQLGRLRHPERNHLNFHIDISCTDRFVHERDSSRLSNLFNATELEFYKVVCMSTYCAFVDMYLVVYSHVLLCSWLCAVMHCTIMA